MGEQGCPLGSGAKEKKTRLTFPCKVKTASLPVTGNAYLPTS